MILVKTDTQPKKYDRTITVVVLTTTKKKTNYFPTIPARPCLHTCYLCITSHINSNCLFQKRIKPVQARWEKGQFLSNYNDYSIIPPTFKLLWYHVAYMGLSKIWKLVPVEFLTRGPISPEPSRTWTSNGPLLMGPHGNLKTRLCLCYYRSDFFSQMYPSWFNCKKSKTRFRFAQHLFPCLSSLSPPQSPSLPLLTLQPILGVDEDGVINQHQ